MLAYVFQGSFPREPDALAEDGGFRSGKPVDLETLLADTGEPLSLVASMLSYFDVDPHAVQIMGPAQWASSASGSGPSGRAKRRCCTTPDFSLRTTAAMDTTRQSTVLR